MAILELFGSEDSPQGGKLNCYTANASSMMCCEALFDLSKGVGKLHLTEVWVTIAGEEMEPDEDIQVSSFSEIVQLNKGLPDEDSPIASCSFDGDYVGEEVSVCVDFDLETVNIASDNENVTDALKTDLENALKQRSN